MENGCRFVELIEKAVYFAKLNRFVESREILQVIPADAYNQNYYLAHALCCIGQENFTTAIYYLELIGDFAEYKILKLLQKCYEKLNDTANVAKVFLKMNPNEIKLNHWIKMFDCFQLLDDESKILQIYHTIMQKFPTNLEIRSKFADYLLEKNHPGFLMTIDEYIRKNPYHLRFHLLKIKHALKHKRLIHLDTYLQYVLYEFPFTMETHYLLMQYYLLLQMPMQVKLYQKSCMNRMNDYVNLSLEFDEFNSKYSQMNQLAVEQCPKQVLLPSIVKKGFEACQAGEGVCYLVGSAVHNLLDNRILGYSQDLDFVANLPPRNHNFISNPYLQNLYTSSVSDEHGMRKKIDYFMVHYASERFLFEDFITRDFTINTLYVDTEGNLSDPTGLGFHDYRHKTLRTVDVPKNSLAKDPIRILRAIKLIAQGYQPVDELNYALANWLPNDKMNYNHLFFVTKKIMYVINPLDFVFYLKHYQLLSKLFIISDHLSDQQVLLALNQRIFPQNHLFFNTTKYFEDSVSLHHSHR